MQGGPTHTTSRALGEPAGDLAYAIAVVGGGLGTVLDRVVGAQDDHDARAAIDMGGGFPAIAHAAADHRHGLVGAEHRRHADGEAVAHQDGAQATLRPRADRQRDGQTQRKQNAQHKKTDYPTANHEHAPEPK